MVILPVAHLPRAGVEGCAARRPGLARPWMRLHEIHEGQVLQGLLEIYKLYHTCYLLKHRGDEVACLGQVPILELSTCYNIQFVFRSHVIHILRNSEALLFR